MAPWRIDFVAIGHDEVHVELDDVAEAMARRAGAERVVEREQPRLRIFVGDAAAAALEPLAEHVQRREPGPHRRRAATANAAPPPSRYAVSIESVSRARRLAVDLHAIDDHLEQRPAARAPPVDVLER